MLYALFLTKKSLFSQISERSTPTDLHYPDLHLAQFFSLESHKISSAYAKTSLGLKCENSSRQIFESFRQVSSRIYFHFTHLSGLFWPVAHKAAEDYLYLILFWLFIYLSSSQDLHFNSILYFRVFLYVILELFTFLRLLGFHVNADIPIHFHLLIFNGSCSLGYFEFCN